MPIRVIAGSARGRRLKMVPGDATRPIMDKVKEALFSILGRNIVGTSVLDLFAGTGSVGIEALSRGAAYVLFVDLDRQAVQTIKENLDLTRLSERATIRRTDALALLKGAPDRTYDYIYIAPPQYKQLWAQVLAALEANPAWIPEGTTVIVQIDPEERADIALQRLVLTDERRYGKTLLLFYRVQDRPSGEESPKE
jgi:16S rRNA (guanine966-N2)-methyltransferase